VNIEETKLISASGVIGFGSINWVARIAQADKVHPFDDASVSDIKARNDTGFQHASALHKRERFF
jgi:hypothetical protein